MAIQEALQTSKLKRRVAGLTLEVEELRKNGGKTWGSTAFYFLF